MHLPALTLGAWYRVVEAPADAAAHMRIGGCEMRWPGFLFRNMRRD
jgi:hypothetical protein